MAEGKRETELSWSLPEMEPTTGTTQAPHAWQEWRQMWFWNVRAREAVLSLPKA